MNFDIPNVKNFCGGNFQDWLEVNLIETCNAHCDWCIERNGYHPVYHADVETIADMAIKSGKTNIILLGGEPLLYKYMQDLVEILVNSNKKVWITTNGLLLTEKYIDKNLIGITGVNISIHHFDMLKNKQITKITIDETKLIKAISTLHSVDAFVRMNCNVIKDQIDTPEKIVSYVQWAKKIGADKVRFAELKQDDNNFIDLAKILNYKYNLNDNPFTHGCNSDCVIEGIPINFRQMCGLQTTRRIAPLNPQQVMKQVLYYDGKMYDGWQINKKENIMKTENSNPLDKAIKKATDDKLNEEERKRLADIIKEEVDKKVREYKQDNPRPTSGGGCQY